MIGTTLLARHTVCQMSIVMAKSSVAVGKNIFNTHKSLANNHVTRSELGI